MDDSLIPSEAAGQLKYFCLGLFLVLAVAGCKPKEQVIENKVVGSGQALITGQIFIVTKGRADVVLGDEKVALLDAHEIQTYFNSKALEWSNALAMAEAKVDRATSNYDAIYKDELAKLAADKKHQEEIIATVSTGTQEWDDAFQRLQKVEGEIRDLQKFKKSSAEKNQFDDAIMEQSRLWDEITWPSADHFWPRIEITTTDSEGRFKFVVPNSYVNSDLELLAKAERQVGDEKENYWWMVDVHLSGKKSAEYILSNDNKDTSGVWGGFWFDDRPVVTDLYYRSPIQKYMDKYITKMEAAKADRDFQIWEENLDEGRESLPPPRTLEEIKADLNGRDNFPALTPEQIKAAQDAEQEAAQIAAQAEKQKQFLIQSNAVVWLKSQATNGSASAQCSLGLHYLNGQGCETNREQAIYWLIQAANQGDQEAANKLTRLQK